VRNGTERDGYTRGEAYIAMRLTIQKEYRSLPNPHKLRDDEIEQYYDALRPMLLEATKPQR